MAKYKVVVTDARHSSYAIEKQILESIDAELVTCNCKTEDDVIGACADADGILLDMAPMTAKCIESLHKCKVINRYGVGYDNVEHFRRLFGDFTTLRTSYERNPVLAATVALKSARLPSLFQACGTEDLLYPRNRAVYRTLTEAGADITWFEAEGNHEWEFFNPTIAAAFQWFGKNTPTL